MTKNWFEVDKEGLAKILERRGKSFILYELVSNAWDQNVTRVNVDVQPVEGRPEVQISVDDDDPNGFSDLSHAFTLFAESEKKANIKRRIRREVGKHTVGRSIVTDAAFAYIDKKIKERI